MKQFDFEKIPIVEIANEILLDGVKKGASDIHFDPSKEDLKIRMRVDGILYDYTVVPGEYKRNMVSRIKMIASMNIMETRLPQDGAIKSKIGDKMLDLRVSSLPTNCGEKVVLRILDYSKSLQGLENLGFSESNLKKILRMIEIPNGIVLVTGATGSGKSTTVYSILSRLNTREVNIITVEDPVEMDVAGINQVQAQQEIGLDFASVLRSILRQDPDIIMIGEIRDSETAKIAVRASITGHKVLSTIHTNSALNTIERLTDMEVERYLIGTSLNGCISQKLARKMCPHCRIQRDTTDYEKSLFEKVLHTNIEKIYDINPKGCEYCMHGYKGRICVAEVLLISDEVRTAITNNVPKDEMRRMVYGHSDTYTLLRDGLEKVALGETNFDEILKLVDLENDIAIHDDLNERGIKQEPFDLIAVAARHQSIQAANEAANEAAEKSKQQNVKNTQEATKETTTQTNQNVQQTQVKTAEQNVQTQTNVQTEQIPQVQTQVTNTQNVAAPVMPQLQPQQNVQTEQAVQVQSTNVQPITAPIMPQLQPQQNIQTEQTVQAQSTNVQPVTAPIMPQLQPQQNVQTEQVAQAQPTNVQPVTAPIMPQLQPQQNVQTEQVAQAQPVMASIVPLIQQNELSIPTQDAQQVQQVNDVLVPPKAQVPIDGEMPSEFVDL